MVLGVALNEVFVPILQKQFRRSSIYLPPEGLQIAGVISIKKAYPGHAKRVMFGVCAFCVSSCTPVHRRHRDDVDIRDWKEVVWAVHHTHGSGSRHDAGRPYADRYLDFASPTSARRQDGGSTRPTSGRARRRASGRTIHMDADVQRRAARVSSGGWLQLKTGHRGGDHKSALR